MLRPGKGYELCSIHCQGPGTPSITEHWKGKHGIDKDGKPLKTANQKSSVSLLSAIDFNIWKSAFIQWLVYCHISFNQIGNLYFKKLVKLLNESVAALMPGRSTTRKWVIEESERRERYLRHELRAARSNIHISSDLWTSPNYYAIMAAIVHYIDSKGVRQAKLIAFRYLDGEESILD
jgi:hypothetical protein